MNGQPKTSAVKVQLSKSQDWSVDLKEMNYLKSILVGIIHVMRGIACIVGQASRKQMVPKMNKGKLCVAVPEYADILWKLLDCCNVE
ncbi:uncharacterized protein MELLADRAFT_56595 [Melampsora larici-populina 98AG31]|uniref:Uncharacterized protein n=1 Tax=Melampsora larici-populina (strain 98AG31 / pathotype 3-4-7) TaxID=747676 RepID=F4RSB5_MELLP|nr:uncharacterized protein MELLADRAFT_56595 [Melampsora larici-populina 98AG31]EGG04567.1 hypothetical protein MELLADRAFT_56595 [Melampsora larici-populina 98AG31]